MERNNKNNNKDKNNNNKVMLIIIIKKLISQIHIYFLALIQYQNLITTSLLFLIGYFTMTVRKIYGDISIVNNRNFLWLIY